jgi:hypothetical protein
MILWVLWTDEEYKKGQSGKGYDFEEIILLRGCSKNATKCWKTQFPKRILWNLARHLKIW